MEIERIPAPIPEPPPPTYTISGLTKEQMDVLHSLLGATNGYTFNDIPCFRSGPAEGMYEKFHRALGYSFGQSPVYEFNTITRSDY